MMVSGEYPDTFVGAAYIGEFVTFPNHSQILDLVCRAARPLPVALHERQHAARSAQ